MVFMTPFIVMTEGEMDTIKQKYEDRLGRFFNARPRVSPDILDPFEPLSLEEEERRRAPVDRPWRPQEMDPVSSLTMPFSAPYARSTPPLSFLEATEAASLAAPEEAPRPRLGRLRREKEPETER